MGLCKCPKRKTTSHFCFHHCVNVCEHCIVNNHTTCVVKSYTTWLKEASGSISSSSISTSALCGVCQKQFVLTPKEFENLTTNLNGSSPGTKTAIRLLCYHVVHARCLSVYVKKQMKEQNILKCPSCTQPLWLQNQIQDSNDTAEVDCNELSPVAFQLYKHLLDHGSWWGNALITNENVEDIEKYLLEDEDNSENTLLDEKSEQLFENQSTLEIKTQMDSAFDNISSLPLAQTIQSPNSNNSYYNYNNSEITNTTSNLTTINHRSNTHQTNQPVHHRLFNNNYGIDSTLTTQQCSFVNMTTAQSSDLNSRHAVTSSTPLLINNDNNLNHDEQQDPSGKNRPKKFNNQFWSFSYQRIFQYFCGANNSTTRVAILIVLCTFIIVVLLLAITSYTRSNNEIFDNNSIDYGGD